MNVPARTVTVEHDCGQTAPADLVLALNGASLGAYIQGANQVSVYAAACMDFLFLDGLQLLRIAYDLIALLEISRARTAASRAGTSGCAARSGRSRWCPSRGTRRRTTTCARARGVSTVEGG